MFKGESIMHITVYTLFWTILGVLSIMGLFVKHGQKSKIINFITDNDHLFLFILSSLFGMRESFGIALTLFILGSMLMQYNYTYHKNKYSCRG